MPSSLPWCGLTEAWPQSLLGSIRQHPTPGSLLRPGHSTRPSAPPQPRFPDSWPLRAEGPLCSNDADGETQSLRSWARCRSRSSFRTTTALTRFEFDDEVTDVYRPLAQAPFDRVGRMGWIWHRTVCYGTRNDWLSRATCDGPVAGAALLAGASGSNRFSGNNSCNTRYTLPPPITTRR